VPKSAVHRRPAPLVARGWAQQSGASSRDRLTVRLTALSQGVLFASYPPELYQPVLECLARDSRELVRLTLTLDERLVWIGAAPARAAGW
jgi:IclR family transcriptional regulator, acetate operon repressor